MTRRYSIAGIFISWVTLGLAMDGGEAESRPRLWILPFEDVGPPGTDSHLGEAIAELLTVLVSQCQRVEVVDRDQLDRILTEQSLSRSSLASAETRLKVSRILGATVLLHGSYIRRHDEVLITVHATEIESSRLLTSHEAKGHADRLADVVGVLQTEVIEVLRSRLPRLQGQEIDTTPVRNLYFMRGLNHYYAGHYNHALVEFMRAAKENNQRNRARLWIANSYLAQREFGHAHLELQKLAAEEHDDAHKLEVERKLKLCRSHLTVDEQKLFEQLRGENTRQSTRP